MYPKTTKQVADLAGVSLRQMQWWDERGIIKANREKGDRSYNREQTIAAMIHADLRRRGSTTKAAKKAAAAWMRSSLGGLKPWDVSVLAAKQNGDLFWLPSSIDYIDPKIDGPCVLCDVRLIREKADASQ